MRFLAVPALVVALAVGARAEEKVDIRPDVKPGFRITSTLKFSGEGTLKGAGQDVAIALSVEEVSAEEVLESEDGRPAKIRRMIHESTETFEIPAAGQADSTSSSLVGHVLLIERRDGKLERSLESGAAAVDQQQLAEQGIGIELDEAIASGRPVGPGDEWEGDPEKVEAWLELELFKDATAASAKLKFEKFETKYGERCARLAVVLKGEGTAKMEGGGTGDLSTTVDGTLWFGTKSGRIVRMTATQKLKLEWQDRGPDGKPAKVAMRVEGKVTGRSKIGIADFGDEGGGK
ncbi:MAG: hypothetical protein HYY18_16020 [Planctomycetes bacterium]|nr:hypothetical protein [Planctomycetota bacterium]